MNATERTAALKVITELKDANYTPVEIVALNMLSDKTIGSLHTLAGKSPADGIIQAKAAADAALAGHAHGLNAQDLADKAKKDAKEKADSAEPKAAEDVKLKAAQAAGFKTVEEHEEATWLAAHPAVKAVVDRQAKAEEERKTTLIAALKGGPLDEKQLQARPLAELETLASYARVETPDYSGQALPRSASEHDLTMPPDGYALALAARVKK